MNEKMKIEEIKFGKNDAHNELQEFGEEYYRTSFLAYEKYKISSFINGENYFICGNKGTGKTAFLKYLECKLSEDTRNLIIPIRFKSIDNVDKSSMRNMANNIREDVIENTKIEKSTSYSLMWQIYLINQIIKNANKGEYHLFYNDNNYNTLIKLLELLYSGERGKIVPKLTKGYAKINASSIKGIDASIGLEIELNKEMKQVNFNKTAKLILDLFSLLEYAENPVYILVDELELSVKNKKEFSRDVELIRDLILAIDKLNHMAREQGYKIKIIAAIRREVINQVLSYGYEINKCVEDYGVIIEWFQKGGSYKDSPLLKIIENKIHASEKINGYPLSEDVWSTYFVPKVNGNEVRKHILSYTWQRPRDIIRMLRFVQDESRGEELISQEMFDRAMQKYSESSWNEIAEELVLSYTDIKDIDAVKKFFTGIEVPFTFTDCCKRAEDLGAIYDYVKVFFEKYKMIDFLEKMYEWGVIGNSGARMAFKFLGDRDLAPTNKMIIHTPLRNFFAVRSRK